MNASTPDEPVSAAKGPRVIRVSAADARRRMAEWFNRVAYGGEVVVVTRHGKDLVAILRADCVLCGPGFTEHSKIGADIKKTHDPRQDRP